ncbi:MAG: T9SS type A sorting domain-containing protein, partial [Bacteroidota bacterium]
LAGQHLLDIHRAHEVDIEAAPASVRQLLVDEFEALGGYDAAGAVGRGGPFGSAASCSRVGTVGGDGPAADIGAGAFATPHLSALAQALQAARGSGERATVLHESLHAAQQTCKTDAEALANDIEAAIGGGDNRLGAQGTRTCTPPPPPPGGPSGGGGGSCGGPAAPADPNDKTVDTPQHRCRVGTILVDGEEVSRCVRYFVPVADARNPILYSIDFENLPLATANAEFVTITDELDPNLDPATLEVLATSSDSTFSVEIAGQTVTFRFVGIDLPPNVDDPEGTGFVTFGVRPRAGLGAGTEIRNEASIVFDFNPPIETPAVIHEIRETADLATALVVPEESSNPAIPFAAVVVNENGDVATEAVVTLSADAPITSASPSSGTCSGVGTGLVTCEVGDLTIGAAVVVTLVLDGSVRGVYTVTSSVASNAFDAFASNDSDTQQVGVLDVGTESPDGAIPREVVLAGARPNPVQAAAVLRWGVPTATAVDLRVYDLRGREVAVLVEGESVIAGWHETTWRPSLATGVYLVRLRAGGEVQTRKLVIVR